MAAAALLRSVARKLACAPPSHPRPLLAGGLHTGARSSGGSLPPPKGNQVAGGLHGGARIGSVDSLPPPKSNQMPQGKGGRLVVGMAAAAGLRSGDGLPSLATKIGRAPPQLHHGLLVDRGLHSSTSPNPHGSGSKPLPTSDKDEIIEDLRRRLKFSTASAGFAGLTLTWTLIYLYFWVLPEAEAYTRRTRERNRKLNQRIRKHESELKHLLAEDVQISGHGKQPDGATLKGSGVDRSEVEKVLRAYPLVRDIVAGVMDMQSNYKEIEALIKEGYIDQRRVSFASKSSPSEGEEKV